MTDVTMMKIGSVLIVPIQVELHDSAAVQLQEDIVQNIEKTGAKGLLIDVSKLQIVDSFLGRLIGDTAAMAKVMGCQESYISTSIGISNLSGEATYRICALISRIIN